MRPTWPDPRDSRPGSPPPEPVPADSRDGAGPLKGDPTPWIAIRPASIYYGGGWVRNT
jgi:hypothetical protein